MCLSMVASLLPGLKFEGLFFVFHLETVEGLMEVNHGRVEAPHSVPLEILHFAACTH